MKSAFYYKIALTNLKKNKKIYFPYILTCIGMIMIFYIMGYITKDKDIKGIKGGVTLQIIMGLGLVVIGVFASIFLFYTYSFIMKKRKKEFGLFNILGMGKRNIAKVMFCESLIISSISIGFGLLFGVVFSKLVNLGLFKVIRQDPINTFKIDTEVIIKTIILFGVIFLVILINSLRQVAVSKPIELLYGSNHGEKRPKGNWVIAIIGIILLAAGYYMALSTGSPMEAIEKFFIAVILVIIGTYFCFIAASVVFLGILKKNKAYYYRTNHFVSVSGMSYRMKRNGAGLATICVLATIVLVMVSAVTCLYIGIDDALKNAYPKDMIINVYEAGEFVDEHTKEVIIDTVRKEAKKEGIIISSESMVDYLQFPVPIINDVVQTQIVNSMAYDNMVFVNIMDIENFNNYNGTNYELMDNEALIMASEDYKYNSITIDGYKEYKIIKKFNKDDKIKSMSSYSGISTMLIIVRNKEDLLALVNEHLKYGDYSNSIVKFDLGYDLECDEELKADFCEKVYNIISQKNDLKYDTFYYQSASKDRVEFFILYAGLFFLGILLGIVFIIATVLIIYYKQVNEGYEDQSRFEIMQKVGMTRREIRKSINSQILTVFFLPLITAGIHLAFSFPMVSKLLSMFGLDNNKLFIIVNLITFMVFGVMYTLLYFVTSKAYYRIVSEK